MSHCCAAVERVVEMGVSLFERRTRSNEAVERRRHRRVLYTQLANTRERFSSQRECAIKRCLLLHHSLIVAVFDCHRVQVSTVLNDVQNREGIDPLVTSTNGQIANASKKANRHSIAGRLVANADAQSSHAAHIKERASPRFAHVHRCFPVGQLHVQQYRNDQLTYMQCKQYLLPTVFCSSLSADSPLQKYDSDKMCLQLTC
jgi:hypothetical protein